METKEDEMGKQNTFKIKHNDPFIVEGENGKYEIPPLEKIPYCEWSDVAAVLNEDVSQKMLDTCKDFFLKICPNLKNEEIGDHQWIQLGTMYFETMGK